MKESELERTDFESWEFKDIDSERLKMIFEQNVLKIQLKDDSESFGMLIDSDNT